MIMYIELKYIALCIFTDLSPPRICLGIWATMNMTNS